jgi:hypothetical protein
MLVEGCNIDPDGKKAAKTGMCPLDATGTFDIPVPAGSYDEVLVLASAGRKAASFKWLIGEVDPRLEILDPLSVRPAQIGDPQAPRPFVAMFVVRDADNEPLNGLAPSNFKVRTPGCAGPKAPTCELVDGTDFTVTNLGSGLYWALGEVPPAFYPTPLPGALDLVVSADVLGIGIVSDTEGGALAASATTRLVTQFVLDKSGSMNALGKLQAMKDAAKLLGEAMTESDEVGLVTFNNDAQTIIGGANVPHLKMTPLGRGIFNAAVDLITAPSRLDVHRRRGSRGAVQPRSRVRQRAPRRCVAAHDRSVRRHEHGGLGASPVLSPGLQAQPEHGRYDPATR